MDPRALLEVGCGQGALAAKLADAGINVTATDRSEQMVAITAARGVAASRADPRGPVILQTGPLISSARTAFLRCNASTSQGHPWAPWADVRRAGNDWQMPHRALIVAGREFRDVLRAATPTHRRLRDALVAIAAATLGIDLVCAIAAFLLERHAHQTEIHTLGSAAFWTTTQLLTVSSQIINPLSVGGRILDIFMEIYAITVIATLAGAFGSFLQRRSHEIDDQTT